jgi:hypothetical protein
VWDVSRRNGEPRSRFHETQWKLQSWGRRERHCLNHVCVYAFSMLFYPSRLGLTKLSRTDLAQLIEDAVDGSWIGHRARTAIMGDSAIGSVYSPPSDDQGAHKDASQPVNHVETVIDIGYREQVHGLVAWTEMTRMLSSLL